MARFTDNGNDRLVFHLNNFERFVASPLLALVFVAIGHDQVTHGITTADRRLGIALMAIAVLPLWLGILRLRLVVTNRGLTVHTVFKTHVVPFTELQDLDQEYEGLRLRLANGKKIVVLAVQRWNISLWSGRHTRADRIREEILRRKSSSEGL